MCCLRCILSIQWSDKMPDVFERAGLSTMFTLLRQCMLQWLDHVRRRWRMAVYPRTSCMVILPLARELLAATNCASKMSASATRRPWTSTQRAGKMQQLTAADGTVSSASSWSLEKKRSSPQPMKREPGGGRHTFPEPSQPATPAANAAEIVAHILDWLATAAAVAEAQRPSLG